MQLCVDYSGICCKCNHSVVQIPELQCSHTHLGKCKTRTATWQSLKMLTVHLPYDLTFLLLGFCSRNIKSYIYVKTHTWVFMAVISDSQATYLCDWANHLLGLLNLDFKTLVRSPVCVSVPSCLSLSMLRQGMPGQEGAWPVYPYWRGDLPSWNTEAIERNGTHWKARQHCGTESLVKLQKSSCRNSI